MEEKREKSLKGMFYFMCWLTEIGANNEKNSHKFPIRPKYFNNELFREDEIQNNAALTQWLEDNSV